MVKMYHILNYRSSTFKSLYTFVWNKPVDSLLEIFLANFMTLKIFKSEFEAIEVWFTSQNS